MNTTPTPLRTAPIALGLAAALSVGTALAQSASAERRLAALGYSKADTVEVVPDNIITSWDYLDTQSVIVHRDTSRSYLVTLAYPCPALETASLISFNAAIAGLGSNHALKVGSDPGASTCNLGPIYQLERNISRF